MRSRDARNTPVAPERDLARASDGTIDESRLDCGVRVLTERIPGVRSVSTGVWVRQGAAHEAADTMGASHLLEHMVFKGTERRSPREIAMALEGLGGSLDAYTSREHTSFQARVLDEHLPEALDVLADLVLAPALREEDLALEREVVLEEISTVEDTPDDLVFELHGERLWNGHPYGHSILGTRETVAGMRAETLRALHAERYRGGNLVVAAAGHVEHAEVVERVAELFGDVEDGPAPPAIAEPAARAPGQEVVVRESTQTHLVVGNRIPGHPDPRRYALVLISAALGGGMSSRLFQRVREELGLAYTVFSFQSFYSRAGITGIYVGTRPDWADRVVDEVRAELADLARAGLDADELEKTKQQVKGQVMLSLESTGARLYRLASLALYDEPFLSLDELLGRVDAVTVEEVAEATAEFFAPDEQLVLRLGPAGG